jgi:hypothetical protein
MQADGVSHSTDDAVPYHELPGFDGYYFEDGWVLGLYASDREFLIDIDAVLTPRHPDFGPPNPGDKYRYRRVAVRFPNVRDLEWIKPLDLRGTLDPDGTVDYGNIDFFVRSGDVSRLGGKWGEVAVTSDMPLVDPLPSAVEPRSPPSPTT